MNELIRNEEARVNVTWHGQNGDLVSAVFFDSTDADVRAWVQEAVRNGTVPGIDADPNANFRDFVVDRFPARDQEPNRLFVRPKTPFGL